MAHLSIRLPKRSRVPALSGFFLAWILVGGCLALTGGCAGIGPARYELHSIDEPVRVTPNFTLRVYGYDDQSTADIYLTTLTRDQLRPGVDLSDVSGHLIHIQMFVKPRPGRTPIAPTAFNAAVTHIVIANGRLGVYRGGGFLLPGGNVGDLNFGGRLIGGTLRLESRSEGFRDLLGASALRANFRAEKQHGTAELARQRMRELIAMTEAVDGEGS